MITTNLPTLKINKLTQAQYERELAAGNLDENALYLTPADDINSPSGSNIPIVTTAGTGAAYTVTVDGLTELTAGMQLVVIPHTVSTTKTPTLNVNGLGAITIQRGYSTTSGSRVSGYNTSWLAANIPLLLLYDGTSWVVSNMPRPTAADLSGTLTVAKGGTGATTAAEALTKLGITYGNTDLTATSSLATGAFYCVYE